MAMLNKAKMMQEEANETPEDEAAEPPEHQEQEEKMGVEQPAAPEENATPEEGAGEEGGLSPEQLQEYQRASQALHNALYKNERAGRAVIAQLSPEDKVGSVARAAVLVLQQLDKQLNFSDAIIPLMIVTVVDRLLELADRVKKIKFSEQEMGAVVNAVTQGVKALYGPPQGEGSQPPQAGQEAAPPQSQGGPTPAGPGLPAAPQAGPAPNPGGEEEES